MKQLSNLILVLCTVFSHAQVSSKYEIIGNLTNAEGKILYLAKSPSAMTINGTSTIQDSCIVTNKKFYFKGFINEPNFYSIMLKDGKTAKNFILENNSKLTFVGNANSLSNSAVTGSYENRITDSLMNIKNTFAKDRHTIEDSIIKYRKVDSIKYKVFFNQIQANIRSQNKVTEEFILKHSNTFSALYQFNSLYQNLNKEKSKSIFNLFPDKSKKHPIGKAIAYNLFEVEKLLSKPISFSQTDTMGKVISTDSLRGNYLLVDFWASWCGPCRKENPTLREAYNTYRNKGFNIIGFKKGRLAKRHKKRQSNMDSRVRLEKME